MSFAKLEFEECEKCNGYKIHVAEFEQNEKFHWNQTSEEDDIFKVQEKNTKRLTKDWMNLLLNVLTIVSFVYLIKNILVVPRVQVLVTEIMQ